MKKIWLKCKSIFHKKDTAEEKAESPKKGVMKVDFRYLYQRRQRMTVLAEGFGMSVDEMVEAVKNRVLEERKQKTRKMWEKRQ